MAAGLIERRDCQFHWFNQGYDSFEHFLATFTAEKRKKAKRERRRVAEAGIDFDTRLGGDMDAALWKTVYAFYADTFYRHGHEPYLNLRFLQTHRAPRMPDRLMLKIARQAARRRSRWRFSSWAKTRLYGRYWGAGGNYHSLHFETCYYQGIEYCIEHRAAALRARHAGRAQGAARLRPDAHGFGPRHRRSSASRPPSATSRRARRAESIITQPPSTSTCPTTAPPDEELRL